MPQNPVSQAPVVIIGVGIVGTCAAINLLREGHRVVMVDQEGPAAGASSGNAGAISPGSCIPLASPGVLKDVPKWLLDRDGPLVIRANYLLQAMPWLVRFLASSSPEHFEKICDALHALHSVTHACYAPILEFAGAAHLIRRTGALTVYESPDAYEASRGSWERRRRRGIAYEVLGTEAIRSLAPALGSRFTHAVLQADHGYVVEPRKLVSELFDAACRNGAGFVRGKAMSIAPSPDGLVVALDSGNRLVGSHVVVAAGASSKALLRSLGHSVPLERQRGYHLHLPDPGIELPLPVSFAKSKFYATPMQSGIRLAGTVEFARPDAGPDFRRAERLGTMASRWLEGLRLDGATQWMGNRPCLPDSLPMIDRLPRHPNVIVAFGHGHNGMTSAPATARLVADLVAARMPFMDIAPYRSNRFS